MMHIYMNSSRGGSPSSQHSNLSSMAPSPSNAALCGLLLVASFATISLSSSQSVGGSVACLDCSPHKDLSGTRVAVKCRNKREAMYAITDSNGLFKADLPANSSSPPSSPSPNCFVRLLGGPVQLWAFKKSMVSSITKAGGQVDSYGLSKPLTFFTSSPSRPGSSRYTDEKTPRLPNMPPFAFPPPANGTGRLPLIFFFPFFPIIGIP